MYLVGVDVPDDPCLQTVCVNKIVYDLGQSRTPVPTIFVTIRSPHAVTFTVIARPP